MKEFDELLNIADCLLGDNGCPWDREQTFFTLQPYLLEETHELTEAIDKMDVPEIAEELGDVLYALVFIAKLAEKENLFSMKEAIEQVSEKLIRRHPHIFGDKKISSTDEVVENWEAVKKQEMSSKGRKTILDGIPLTLPALPRTQKILQKLKRVKSDLFPKIDLTVKSEEEIGESLWKLLAEAENSSIHAESALRRFSARKEEEFRKKNTGD